MQPLFSLDNATSHRVGAASPADRSLPARPRLLHALVMPPLIRFLLKWSLIGMAAGWLFVALLLLADTGGLWSLLGRADSPVLAVFIMGFSFSISFAQVTVLAAVLLGSALGGHGPSGSDRLERWKAGRSAARGRGEP